MENFNLCLKLKIEKKNLFQVLKVNSFLLAKPLQ